MNLQVLVSTMNQKDFKLITEMNIQSNVVVVNQTDIESTEELMINNFSVKWINTKTRGLSISRNIALANADADICVIADDDLCYRENYRTRILSAFEKNRNADIITFRLLGIEKQKKKYPTTRKKVGYLSSMKISSCEISFRLKSIKTKLMKFDEMFGSGSKYSMGEENIFLVDALRAGLKIIYEPFLLADIHFGESSWFRGFTEKYFIDRGAIYFRMLPRLSSLLALQFAIRKYKIYKKEMSFISSIKNMRKGIIEYRKSQTK